ncbi:MAG: zinc-binding dehydrogenase [Deltaproteobacteria bacterium]|nr:zinc-binding dehydrogenase [Deltaproteobacteria bacterium]
MERMRAAQMVAPGKMECVQAAVRPPRSGELLVKTQMASICGSDLHVIYHGVSQPPEATFPYAPGFPGHEGVGEVLESKAPGFNKGDLVLTCPQPPESHCFAEYQTLEGELCLKLPAFNGPISHLMMAQQLGTVIFALRQNPVDVVGRTVMVQGQGSAGMFFAYLLKRAGARKVIVSDLSEGRLAQSRRMGADVAVKATGDSVRQAVLDHTNGLGADYVVEAVGSRGSLLESVDLARLDGTLLLFGLPDGNDPVPFNFHDFFRKRLKASSPYGTQREPGRVSFQMALDLIASKQIDVGPLVSHVFGIEKVQEALDMAHHRTGNALKVSIQF